LLDYLLFVDQPYVLFLGVLVVAHVVHALEQRLLLGEIDGSVDDAFVPVIFPEIALNKANGTR
jgi:hypothetical protein